MSYVMENHLTVGATVVLFLSTAEALQCQIELIGWLGG